MCGIVYANNYICESLFKDSLDLIKHRGPDFQGVIKDRLGMWGHARLSFLDLTEKSNQPIKMATGDKLIYNGEIFNYRDFGEYNSDTLMLSDFISKNNNLNALIYSMNKFNGFFSFVFSKKNLINVVRDRFGEKPCYILIDNKKFGVASEIKALNKLNRNTVKDERLVRLALDPFDFKNSKISVGLYETIYENIYELKPGYALSYDTQSNNFETSYWYDLKNDIMKNKDSDFRLIYEDAVKIRTIADVKGAFTLSGGVDSTLNCAISKIKLHRKVNSFSIASSNENYSELLAITQNAKKITDSNFIINEKDLLNGLNFDKIFSMIKHFDSPYFDPNVVQYGLYEVISKYDYKFVIDGHGADELFSGYQWHMPHLFYHATINGNFYKAVQVFKCFWNMYPANYSMAYKMALFFKSIYTTYKNKNQSTNINSSDESSIRYSEMFDRVMVKLLNNYDITSMKSSIETRTPFLDHRLVANILSKPNSFFIGNQNKIQLRNFIYDVSQIKIGNKKIGLRSYLWEHLDENTIKKLLELYNMGVKVADNKFFNKIRYIDIKKLSPSEEVRLWKGISIGVFKA
jgi:asparagine synthase (glutamine-hydrolysing)